MFKSPPLEYFNFFLKTRNKLNKIKVGKFFNDSIYVLKLKYYLSWPVFVSVDRVVVAIA